MRTCTKCTNGTMAPLWEGDTARPCYHCDGVGSFAAPDIALLRDLVVNPKTNKPWSTSFHSAAGRKRVRDLFPKVTVRRAQYVWRMIGWHTGTDGRGANLGGAIMADMDLGADAYKRELDQIADFIAVKCFGEKLANRSVNRWRGALYGNDATNDVADLFTK